MLFFGVFLRESPRTAAKSRTNLTTNSGKANKRLGRLAHTFGTHVQIHMGMDIRQTNCPSRHKGGTWEVLGVQQFKNIGKLSDWHHLWFTSADSSGNGHRLNTSRPSIPQGAFRRGVRASQIKVWGSCQTAGPIGTNFGSSLRIRWEWA